MKWRTGSLAFFLFLALACSTTYRAKPLPFKSPSAYPNATEVAGALVGAVAYTDSDSAKSAFGFDIRGAGMLPVQVVFDNRGGNTLEINASQSFLEDGEGNLWPVLSSQAAYARATKYMQTEGIFKEGAYHGFLGAAAGAVIGAAVGIISGENVAKAAGKGAAAGAAAGATIGGASGYNSDDARRAAMDDLRNKSLKNKAIRPKDLAYGFLFFPGEAGSAASLRLRLVVTDTGEAHLLVLRF